MLSKLEIHLCRPFTSPPPIYLTSFPLSPRAAASLFAVVKAGEAALKRARAASDDGGNATGEGTLQPSLPRADANYLLSALDRMDSVFGIFYEPAGYDAGKGAGGDGDGELGELPEVMAELLARRLAARESKDWATADAVRDEIKALGYAVKVSDSGFRGLPCCRQGGGWFSLTL